MMDVALLDQLMVTGDYREDIAKLEVVMLDAPQVEMVTKHYFAHGTYTRELHIPAGTLLTGKIHRHSCINLLTKGRIQVISDEGSAELAAPYTFVSGPDVKKAGLALEDSIWVNVHPWNGTDTLEQIEHHIIDNEVALCHGSQQP